ncbi:bacteriophage T4 gp5 trimerisation domain-containing protein, partial [Marinomonas arctica]
VLNDSITHIGHDQHRQIDNDRFTQIGGENGTGNDHLTIKGESRHKIDKDHTLMVDGSLQQKVGSKAVLDTGNEIHLSSGVKLVVNAGAELTLMAGGSFLKIDGSGVHLVGSAINLNSGGGAGSGSGFSEALPEIPLSVASPEYDANLEAPEGNEAPIVPMQQKQAIVTAAEQGTPICQACEEAAAE